jgi:hypothetical protein
MSQLLTVSGTDLRYLLTAYLFDHGPATVDELVDALAYHGFRPSGRPSKAVSDALRWEMAHRRAIRRAMRHRIVARVRTLHDEVAALSCRGGSDASLTA